MKVKRFLKKKLLLCGELITAKVLICIFRETFGTLAKKIHMIL